MTELAVARVVSATEHAGARGPSLLLELDLGPHGRAQASVPLPGYAPDDLEGRQIVVRRDADEVVVVGAQSHARGLVLLRPDHDVEDGTVVG